jgi:hypothetical protein
MHFIDYFYTLSIIYSIFDPSNLELKNNADASCKFAPRKIK